MSRKEALSKKIDFLLKLRDYSVEDQVDKEDLKDIVVIKKGAEGKILIRIVYKTPLALGKVGVHYVRKMRDRMEKEGYRGGILIGYGFSHSAVKEAKNNRIEAISEGLLPSFDLFNHDLVPKHEVLSKEEAEELLKRYRIKPYKLPRIKASDPVVMLIGAKPGDIVKIKRKSLTAGNHVTYRYVV